MKRHAHTTVRQPAGSSFVVALAGQIEALDGPVWLTVADAPEDWGLHPGERLRLPAGARIHAGPWQAGQPAGLAWRPLRHAVRDWAAQPPSDPCWTTLN